MRTATLLSEKDSLDLYLEEIKNNRTLTAQEEAELAVRIRRGEKKALERLVKANLRFVVSVARNYQNQGLPLNDLINEGNLGLIKAARKFDEKKNFKFISYAVWWIRQAILKSLAEQSRIINVPLHRVGTISDIGKAQNKLEQELERVPTAEEIAREMGVEEREVNDILRIGNRHVSLDKPMQNDEDFRLIDSLHNHDQELPDSGAIKVSLSGEIEKLLDTLSAAEKEVIKLYFGIGQDTAHTLEEIGKRVHLTRERVRQIKQKGLRRLRNSYRSKKLRSFM
ncbi:MAG TPA: RNA polymerase sigma factor RpoD/SigA [Chitinivibrionales bacterium]|jgi:RNA polymerase primary sigma factor|nr:RNA polymerase sigma factor RpoD/SigA [Chitinivibrionales bacterium]